MEAPKPPLRAQDVYSMDVPLKLDNGIEVSVVLDNSKNNAVKTTYFSHKRGLKAEVKTSQYYSHADDIVNALFDVQKEIDPETSKSAPVELGKEKIRRQNFYRSLRNTKPPDTRTKSILEQIEKWTPFERSLLSQAKVNDILDDEIYEPWKKVKSLEEATAFFESGAGKSLIKIVERGHFYHVRTTVLTWVFYKLFPNVAVNSPNPLLFVKNFPAAGFIRVNESPNEETFIKLNIVDTNIPDDVVFNNFWFFRLFLSKVKEKTFQKIEAKSLAKRLGMPPSAFKHLKLQKVTPLLTLPAELISMVNFTKQVEITGEYINDNTYPLLDIRVQGKVPLDAKKELPLDNLSIETVRFLYADIVPAINQPFTVNIMRDVGFLMDSVFENVDEIWLSQLVQSMNILSEWEKFVEVMSNWILDRMYYNEAINKYAFTFASNINFPSPNQKKKFEFSPIKKDVKNKDLVKEELSVSTYYNHDFWSDLSYVRNGPFYDILKQYLSKYFEPWFRAKMPRDFNVGIVLANPPYKFEIDRIIDIVLKDYPDDGEEEQQEIVSSQGSEEEIIIPKQTIRQKLLTGLLSSTRINYDLQAQTVSVPQKMQKQ